MRIPIKRLVILEATIWEWVPDDTDPADAFRAAVDKLLPLDDSTCFGECCQKIHVLDQEVTPCPTS